MSETFAGRTFRGEDWYGAELERSTAAVAADDPIPQEADGDQPGGERAGV